MSFLILILKKMEIYDIYDKNMERKGLFILHNL